MRILFAPHHFGSLLPPHVAAQALARGWRAERPEDVLELCPQSNGGAGFLDLFEGTTELLTVSSLGQQVPVPLVHTGSSSGSWGQVFSHTQPFKTASPSAPSVLWQSSSAPCADFINAALRKSADSIVIGLGYTPWHDGGAGLLRRLGQLLEVIPTSVDLRLPSGGVNPDLGRFLPEVRTILKPLRIVVAANTDAPLRGLDGAGSLLSDTHGIPAGKAQELESALADFTENVDSWYKDNSPPDLLEGSRKRLSRQAWLGAGGGVAYILAALGAQVRPGAWVSSSETGLRQKLAHADLVITGSNVVAGEELGHGVVAQVAQNAAEYAVPVVVVGGQIDGSRRQLFKAGIHAAYPVTDTPASRPQILAGPVTEEGLEKRGRRLARTWSR